MATPLLRTKLYIPPPRSEQVPRPRLLERIDAGLSRKLTLVSAPAGFGKTTLLTEWVHGRGAVLAPAPLTGRITADAESVPLQVAWLSLDAGDNDLRRFLSYVVAALQTAARDLGQETLSALDAPGKVDAESVLTLLLNEMVALPDRVVLVLDDYHAIESPPVHEALSFLLDHLPPPPGGMHLVLASRSDPAVPLSRLRARGEMTELRAADLRFTTDEAAAFLQAHHLPVSPDDVRTLQERTEGWITGLQLAALALQALATQATAMQGLAPRDAVARFVHNFGGSHRYVIDYLVDEVLDRQAADVQAFLLQTSILDRMTALLCDAVVGRKDSQVLLEWLDAANLFVVPLDGERRWYRYHHLFADLLRQRLQQSPSPPSVPPAPEGQEERSLPSRMWGGEPSTSDGPIGVGAGGAGVAELHIRASVWYEGNGMPVDAFRHAAAAGDFERTLRLVRGEGMPLYFRGVVTPVLNWLESLPKSQLDARPSLWVMYAEVLQAAGRFADIEAVFQSAETALQEAKPNAHTRDLLGTLSSMRATMLIGLRKTEAVIALARRALELVRPDNAYVRAAANWVLGYAHQMDGDRAAARAAFAEALAISEQTHNVVVSLLSTTGLGNLAAAENRLHQATQHYRRALEGVGEHPLPLTAETYLGLGRVCYEWNDLDAAHRHGQQSVKLARQMETSDIPIAGQMLLARVKLAQDDLDGAAEVLDQAQQSIHKQGFSFRIPEVAAVQILALLRQDDRAAAARLANAHALPFCRARVHLARGDAAAALALLEPLRRQAEAQGWPDQTLQAAVLQALALRALGEPDPALHLLDDALALAEPGGFIRTFVDEGAPMAQLLSQAAARGMMPDYVARLLAAFEGATADDGRKTNINSSSVRRPLSLVEALSPRELQVLELIAQGLSNREIGERLFLALDTIKGHNRRIYGKLGVKNRTQAVSQARALGLLSPHGYDASS